MPPPSRPASPIASDAAPRGCRRHPHAIPTTGFLRLPISSTLQPALRRGFISGGRDTAPRPGLSSAKARLNRLRHPGADDPAGSDNPLSQALFCHQTPGQAHPALCRQGAPLGAVHRGQQLRGLGIGACCADDAVRLRPRPPRHAVRCHRGRTVRPCAGWRRRRPHDHMSWSRAGIGRGARQEAWRNAVQAVKACP
jgi:hypothetical protein